jgi:SOS-response transcriptional repressor LexA
LTYVDATVSDVQTMKAVRSSISRRGYSPSLRDLGRELGLSVNGVKYRLLRLEALGWIKRDYGETRSIRIVQGKRVRVARSQLKQTA